MSNAENFQCDYKDSHSWITIADIFQCDYKKKFSVIIEKIQCDYLLYLAFQCSFSGFSVWLDFSE